MRVVRPEVDDEGRIVMPAEMHGAIFLAGPCPRQNYEDDWRFEAIEMLEQAGFEGTVINPTNDQYGKLRGINNEGALAAQTDWERRMMHLATRIVFWIPRSKEHPAFTTNIEFGEWYQQDGVLVGWPDGALKNDYIECKLHEVGKARFNSLAAMLAQAVSEMNERRGPFFTSDTHFGQQRTLKLSRRPFRNVLEMDLKIISNWNKCVGMNDTVYHAGDFGALEVVPSYLGHLNFGKLCWTFGNYDRKDSIELSEIAARYVEDHPSQDIQIADLKWQFADLNVPFCVNDGGRRIFICHEPFDVPVPLSEGVVADALFCYGHIHGRAFAKRNGIDVGCDYHNYRPISLEQVKWFMDARQYWDDNVWCGNVAYTTGDKK